MRVAITGARGRLGKMLRHYLEGRSYDVFAYSRRADADHRQISTLAGDLMHGGYNAIVHLAWSTVPSTAEADPGTELRVDVPLLSTLLRDVDRYRLAGNHPPLLLFFSSCAVYGEASQNCQVFDETCAMNPIGWYARGKVHAEQLIGGFVQRGNPTVVLRVTNPYGFSQDASCMQGVIPALVRAAVQGEEFPMWGGDSMKDYLHISDLCRAVERVVQGGLQGTYNVASGHSVSLSDLVGMVGNVTGHQVKCRVSSPAPWDVRSGRYSHQALTKATGWRPKVDLEEGLPALVRLFKDMPTP